MCIRDRVCNGMFADRVEVLGVLDFPGDVFDVLARVTLFRPARLPGLQTACTRLHRPGELVDLCAGVVVVELARDLLALRLEQRGDRVAERRLPAVPDVQGTG